MGRGVGGWGGEKGKREKLDYKCEPRGCVYEPIVHVSKLSCAFDFFLMERFKNAQKRIREPIHLWSFYQGTPGSGEGIREDSPSNSSV